MSTVLLRNNTKGNIPLGSQLIRAGMTIKVDGWEFKESGDVVQSMLRAKFLEVVPPVKIEKRVDMWPVPRGEKLMPTTTSVSGDGRQG